MRLQHHCGESVDFKPESYDFGNTVYTGYCVGCHQSVTIGSETALRLRVAQSPQNAADGATRAQRGEIA
jgi:hypothetical protein